MSAPAELATPPAHACPALPCLQWVFTAVPKGGGKSVVVKSQWPHVTFEGLSPGTEASGLLLPLLAPGAGAQAWAVQLRAGMHNHCKRLD